MKRKVFRIVTVISLLLCVATVALWVRSYWIEELICESRMTSIDPNLATGIGPYPTSQLTAITIVRGRVVCWRRWKPDYATEFTWNVTSLPSSLASIPPSLDSLWFSFDRHRRWVGDSWVGFTIPLWAVALLTAVMPALWLLTLRRHGRGGCSTCGYDLTGNTSGICPECGAACKAADPAGVSPAAGD